MVAQMTQPNVVEEVAAKNIVSSPFPSQWA